MKICESSQAGCCQGTVYRHIQGKWDGRKKRCSSLRDNHNLKRVVKGRPSRNMGRFPKSGLEPEAVSEGVLIGLTRAYKDISLWISKLYNRSVSLFKLNYCDKSTPNDAVT